MPFVHNPNEADYLFGSKKRKKAAVEANKQAMNAILSSGQQLSNAQIQTMMLGADGKINRKDKKLIKQATRLDAKTDRVAIRADTKQVREAEKTKRVPVPVDTGFEALSPMDVPGSPMPMVSGGGGGESYQSIPSEYGMQQNMQQEDQPDTSETPFKTSGIFMLVVLAIIAYLFFFRKK